MGSFLEGLKAGFLGSAGVDYYSMKSAEELERIRIQQQIDHAQRVLDRTPSRPTYSPTAAPVRHVASPVAVVAPPEQWFDVAMPFLADLDQCLAWARWVILYRQDEIESALERLIVATSGWQAFIDSTPCPASVRSTMTKYSTLVSRWERMAEDWLEDRDTTSLTTRFVSLNQEWTDLDDEILGLR